jgi:hypothetical protein
VTITEFLRMNDLRLVHPGHGHNDGEMPVLFSELERLDREYQVSAVVEVHR